MTTLTPRRNDPCPCGSGRKYKSCCLGSEQVRDSSGARLNEQPLFGGLTAAQFQSLDQTSYRAACELDRKGQDGLGSGDYEEARTCFLRAIELCPELPFWYNNLALTEFSLGHLEAARLVCHRVVSGVDATNVFARCMLAQCSWIVGDADELDHSMRGLRELRPPDPSVLVKLLETYGRFGMHGEVLALIDHYPADLRQRLMSLVVPIIHEIGENGGPADDEMAASIEPLRWFLERASEPKGMHLTPSGYVGVKIAQAADERFGWYAAHGLTEKPSGEQSLGELTALRELATSLGLVRKQRSALLVTKRGRALLDDVPGLWAAAVRGLLAPAGQPSGFLHDAREIVLGMLVVEGRVGKVTDVHQLIDMSGDILATRWDMPVTEYGDGQRAREGYLRDLHDALDPLRVLGFLNDNRGASRTNVAWEISLTNLGKTAAAVALIERLRPDA